VTPPTYALEKAERINAADHAELTYDDDSRVQLNRDSTGASRWQFRAYNPGQPDPVAQGTLTAEGVILFVRAKCEIVTSLDEPSTPVAEGDAEPTE
jgi:hypothetical protein